MALNAQGPSNSVLSPDRQSADPDVFCDTPLENDVDCEFVWSDHNLLALDGGGIRGYWSLLVLRQLMDNISQRELEHKTCRATHSFHPLPYPEEASQLPLNDAEKREKRMRDPAGKVQGLDAARRYLPCHYFDYIGGTSTGA
ncbi:hypothetical protein LTR10_005311 [Elasticomyces elasticus]|nr:hypothetical protein LTR10_005311 [Elasticomyces elasticus]KAK4976047.1 hypothetical protein LTR42_003672 [Elasticomyces elasticus]